MFCDAYVCDELEVQADLDDSAERCGNSAEQCDDPVLCDVYACGKLEHSADGCRD